LRTAARGGTRRHAAAILAAHCSASSREGTSTTANPPMTSLVSGYGPSVTVPSVEILPTVSAVGHGMILVERRVEKDDATYRVT
jgi:hypothetical protein